MNKRILFLLLIPASIAFAIVAGDDAHRVPVLPGFGESLIDAAFKKESEEKSWMGEGADALKNVGAEKFKEWAKEELEELFNTDKKIVFKDDASSLGTFSFDQKVDEFLKNNNKTPASNDKPILFNMDPFLEKQPVAPLRSQEPNPLNVFAPKELAESSTVDYIRGATLSANGGFMKKALEKIVSGGNGTAQEYIISMERISPLITSSMKQIQTWANQLNAMSIMSNDLVSLLSPGLLPKRERAAAYLCEHALAANENNKIDLVGARHFTAAMGKDHYLENASGLENQFIKDVDVADKILESTEVKKKNLLMAITGTVKVGNAGQIEIVLPRYRSVLHFLQTGDKKEFPQELPENNWEQEKVFKKLKKIQRKLRMNDSFTKEEEALLNETGVPMGSLISLLTQYKGTGAEMAIRRYAGLISYNRALQFVEEASRMILDKAKAAMAVQVSGYELKAYIDQVEEVLRGVGDLKNEQHRKMAEEHQALETMISLERSMREKEKGL